MRPPRADSASSGRSFWDSTACSSFLRDKYQSFVGRMLGAKAPYLVAFVLIVVAMGFLFQRMPTSYLPDEDQGILMVQVQLPAGSTREQTDVVMEKVRRHFLEDQKDAVESCMTVTGMSFAGTGQNQGLAFIMLKDWKLRDRPDLRAKRSREKRWRRSRAYETPWCSPFRRPLWWNSAQSTGFDFMLQDRGGLGHEKLMEARGQLLDMAAKDPRLIRVRPNGLDDVPEYRTDVDWEKAGALGSPHHRPSTTRSRPPSAAPMSMTLSKADG